MNILSQAKKAVETHPAKITAAKFLAMIDENPSVFEHWETPLEITEYVDCRDSNITHLSPHLTFSGKDNDEWSATFSECERLETATGTFRGFVSFANSNIKKIDKLQTFNKKQSASFFNCKSLEIATGHYPGFVWFTFSGIHSIQNLHIENPNKKGEYADFKNCDMLKTLKGWDLSKEIEIEPEKLAAEKERQALLKFKKETEAQTLPFL
jgi:hypothetical protein